MLASGFAAFVVFFAVIEELLGAPFVVADAFGADFMTLPESILLPTDFNGFVLPTLGFETAPDVVFEDATDDVALTGFRVKDDVPLVVAFVSGARVVEVLVAGADGASLEVLVEEAERVADGCIVAGRTDCFAVAVVLFALASVEALAAFGGARVDPNDVVVVVFGRMFDATGFAAAFSVVLNLFAADPTLLAAAVLGGKVEANF